MKFEISVTDPAVILSKALGIDIEMRQMVIMETCICINDVSIFDVMKLHDGLKSRVTVGDK